MKRNEPASPTHAERIFRGIVSYRWPVLVLSLLGIVATAAFVPGLHKDTRSDAFLRADNPALVYRDKVEALFGLKEPIVVAVMAKGTDGIFTAPALELVRHLSEGISRLPNVDPERVTSLATEKNIVGNDEGILVEEFFEPDPDLFQAPFGTAQRAREIGSAIDAFALYQGSLVSRDSTATLIVAELIDQDDSEQTYEEIDALVRAAPVPEGVTVHIAGEGAVSGRLSAYIDADASRLNPIAALIITLVLATAFVSLRAAVVPNLIVLGTLAGTLGLMAAFGVSFFVITNGLVANLIGMAVADSIHIFSQYYEELAQRPNADKHEVVVHALVEIWRPVLLTSLTTIAGFLALAASADMPPVRYFGLFGALGVALAWLYSMTLLPAAMAIWPGRRLPRPFRTATADHSRSTHVGLMPSLGRIVLGHPKAVLALGVLVAASGAVGASKLLVNESRIDNFRHTEPLWQADRAINSTLDGVYHLDVMVETDAAGALYEPRILRKIEALQAFLVEQPHVNGTTSIVDYLKQLNRAVNENRADAYAIPDNAELTAQLFFLYNASADPTDFEQEVDYDFQRALVRANVDENHYVINRQLVPAVERYLEGTFNEAGLKGTVTGRINVDYRWIDTIAQNHLASVLLSFAAVCVVSMLLFRSIVAGLVAVVPVGFAVLLVYALMGFAGVWLGVGTSMFAAIAIGLGIDFAIHAVDRIREIAQRQGLSGETLLPLFATTGRALLFNFIAVAAGFGVLLTSEVPPLVRFGALVVTAISAAFLASVTLVPALVMLLKPKFLTSTAPREPALAGLSPSTLGVVALCVIGLGYAVHGRADSLSGKQIMERVNARNDGAQVTRSLEMTLKDRRGSTRVEKTVGYRKYFGKEKRTILFYTDPTNVRGTGFLTFDYPDPSIDDDQWLYLPALRKVRRVSASDRGDYFLGTDLTYEEIKKEQKVELDDYAFTAKGVEQVDGRQTLVVEGIPVNDRVARELRYSRVVWRVDPAIWMSRRSDYYDLNGNHLKSLRLVSVQTIEGIVTATEVFAENHKTGHTTRLKFTDIDYETAVPDAVFDQNRLRRGL